MASFRRAIFIWVVFIACLAYDTGAIRVIEYPALSYATINPGHGLLLRLEAAAGGGTLVNCWDALVELRSCSNEIIVFFLNGETNLGTPCCAAIDIITQSCWPAMLTSLGFTPEEGNILRIYCDAKDESQGPAPSPTSSSSA